MINNLIDSMPQRCSTLLAVRGNHTPYWKWFPLKKTPFLNLFFSYAQIVLFSFCTEMRNKMHFFLPNMCNFFSSNLLRLSTMYQSAKKFPSHKIHLKPQYPLIVLSSVDCAYYFFLKLKFSLCFFLHSIIFNVQIWFDYGLHLIRFYIL